MDKDKNRGKSPLREFKFAALAEIDGGLGVEHLQLLLKAAAADIWDRPGDPAKRKVSLIITMRPIVDQRGELTEVKFALQAKSSLPAYQTREYSAAPRAGGMLVVNIDSIDNANQQTFLEDEE